jgi:hypothetical protein
MKLSLLKGMNYIVSCSSYPSFKREVRLNKSNENRFGQIEYIFESNMNEIIIIEEIGGILFPFVWYFSKKDIIVLQQEIMDYYPFENLEQIYIDIVECGV